MGAEKDVSKDAAASEGVASNKGSSKQTKALNDEPVPDPSADFLKRKARLRKEAAAAKEEAADQPDPPSKRDFTGGYRGNTTSGSFRPSMHGHGK